MTKFQALVMAPVGQWTASNIVFLTSNLDIDALSPVNTKKMGEVI